MLKNYFLVAFRSMRRQPGYAAINVGGLSLGLACCILIVLYVRSERAVDQGISDAEHIYRLGSEWAEGASGPPVTAPAPLGPEMVDAFAEVEESVHFWAGALNVRDGAAETNASPSVFRRPAYVADSNTLTFFGLPLLHGDPGTALDMPRSVVIHERLAKAVFGTSDAVGQSLLIETYTNGDQPYTVTGVWADVPFNSFTHFGDTEYELITSFAAGDLLSEDDWLSWGNLATLAYIKLTPGTDVDALHVPLERLVSERAPADVAAAFTARLEPFSTLYLDDADGKNRKAIELLSGLAVLILLVACINFANLATARVLDRGKEIGVRKAIGAQRGQLVGLFLAEALIVASVATVLGALLARGLQAPFFALAGKPLVLADAWGLSMLLVLVGIAVATGVLSGLYPALMLSGFQPVRALKGTLRSGPTALRLRQGLVVTQFGAAVLLLAGAAIVYVQVEFLNSASLGFETEQILAIESVPRDWSPEGVARLQPVKDRLEAVPGVHAVSLSWETAAEDTGNTFPLRRIGQPFEDALDVARFVIDEDYQAVYDLRLVDGAFLDMETPGVLLNERAALALDVERAGESLVLMDSSEVEVQGIVRDFHYASLHEPIRPLVMVALSEVPLYRTFSLRFDGGAVAETLQRTETAWSEVLPEAPFDYTFVDDQVAAKYVTERRTGTVVGLTAMLAVLVAGLGVFGLVSISVFQRRREIGVRKVLGASVPSLVGLFAGHFGKLALVGALVAVPVAYWLSERWLEAFAYRIAIGPAPFLFAGGLVLGLALALVSVQALRAATADPIRALRAE